MGFMSGSASCNLSGTAGYIHARLKEVFETSILIQNSKFRIQNYRNVTTAGRSFDSAFGFAQDDNGKNSLIDTENRRSGRWHR